MGLDRDVNGQPWPDRGEHSRHVGELTQSLDRDKLDKCEEQLGQCGWRTEAVGMLAGQGQARCEGRGHVC